MWDMTNLMVWGIQVNMVLHYLQADTYGRCYHQVKKFLTFHGTQKFTITYSLPMVFI
jgi:hypothetical protein